MAHLSKKEKHTLAKDRFKEIMEFESSERILMEEDKEFSLGEDNAQWIKKDWESRKSTGRSFLTIMRSNQFTDHVKNQQRQNKPSVKISPTDEGAQEEIAERRQGLIRHIQYESKAGQARQSGFDDAVDEGRGHWIVKTEFVEGTFNKKVVVVPLPEARAVYMDIRRQRPDYSDCKFGFVITPIARKVFEEKNPNADIEDWAGIDNDFWYTDKDIMVAEYYVEEYKTRNLIEVAEGKQTRILWEDELEETEKDSLNIVNERKVEDPYWMWYKMTGAEIIDEEELPWKEIPIITCIGKENTVGGDWSCKGLIRDIKQPLRLYNFISSNEADIIAKAPRAPWVGAEGQFEGFEQDYADSNTSDTPYLQYKMVSLGDKLAPPPARAQYSVDLSNITQQKLSILEDIRAITGLSLANLGERSNETSGVAIKARASQGDASNYHFTDNFALAIGHEGRVINSALNIIYDAKRTITIMGEDDEESLLGINGEDDVGLGEGNFNVTVSVGPSFNTQREEMAQGYLELANSIPSVQAVGASNIVRAQDWPGAKVLADKLEFFEEKQFPGITAAGKKDDGNDEMMALQAELKQCQAQLQQIQQQAEQLQQALEKSGADKNAAEVQKQQNVMQELQIKSGTLQLEEKKIMGELKLKAKELEMDGMRADLESETKLKINDDSLEVDLIIDANKSQDELSRLDKEQEHTVTNKQSELQTVEKATSKEVAKITDMFEKKIEDLKSPTKKETKVTKTGKDKYTFETKANNGEVTTGTVKKTGSDYSVKSKTKVNDGSGDKGTT